MSDKLLGQLEAAKKKVAQLDQQRMGLIETQAKATADLETIVDEAGAMAAMARARVSGNKLAIVERDLAQARQEVKDLDLRILQGQIAEIEQQLQMGRATMEDHLVKAMDEARTYHELSRQRAALREKAGDPGYSNFDQLGNAVAGGCHKGLVALGWVPAVTADFEQIVVPPKS